MDIESAIAATRALSPSAAIAREAAKIRRDEIEGSLAIEGSRLTREQLDALCDRGFATGDHPLDAYLAARDLAAASAWVAEQRALKPGDPRPLITVEDVRRLHVIATASAANIRPGVWRLAVEPPDASAIVYPAPWLVSAGMTALVDRYRRHPVQHNLAAWIAEFLGRYMRLRPFGGGNGRASRLAAALLLRRLDVAPVVIRRDRANAYRSAISASARGDSQPLYRLIEDALMQSARRLIATGREESLQPLRLLAGVDYAALIKAAKRGRLDVVVRDGRVLSTPAWIEEYRSRRWSARIDG